MPWYMKPALACKVLHRIAKRNSYVPLQELNVTMDRAAQKLWEKQLLYHSVNAENVNNSFTCNIS